MKVIGIGDLQMMDGAKFPGIVVQATREELQAAAGNILYKDVVVAPVIGKDIPPKGKNGNFWDGKFAEMVDALIAINQRVLTAKASRKYTRDEVLAMLDEIDPGEEGGEKCQG